MKNKLKRVPTAVLLPVADNRRGDCNRCGECCKLPYPCPFLRYDAEGLSSCAIYHIRPPSCRKYPRTASENLTAGVCGFYFVDDEQSAPVKKPLWPFTRSDDEESEPTPDAAYNPERNL